MALTVKETKAGNRPASGYPTSVPLLSPQPLRRIDQDAGETKRKTLLSGYDVPLKLGPRPITKRGSLSRPVLGPMGTKERTIIP
jgi:hypothetical protein